MGWMSTSKKGTAKEIEVMKIFEKAGYMVARPGKQVLYIPDGHGSRRPVVSDMDLFGAFDLIAIKETVPVTFIQVCSKDPGDVAERRRKIEGIPLSRTAVAMVLSWHGGGKRLDRRFKEEKRYRPYQYYNLYIYKYNDQAGEWVWTGPHVVFRKVQLDNRCWVCNARLGIVGICREHPWADNGVVIR